MKGRIHTLVLHAALGTVDPVSLSYRKVTYPTAQGRASLARRLRLLLPSKARACFVWEFVCGRSAAPNRGYWHLCRAVGGGARGPACRAPGSIGGVFGLSPSLLIPGRAAFCSLCCQIYPRRSGFCLHLAPSCWYLTRPTLLPLVRNDSACSCPHSDRLIDCNRSVFVQSFQLSNASGLAGGCSNLRLDPSSRILQCGILQYQHQHPAPASHNQPTPPSPSLPPSLTPPPPLCSGVLHSVRAHAAATYRTAPRERQRQQLVDRPGSRDSRQCMPRRAASTSCIAQIASHPVVRLPQD
jgi:hypothetical protein